MAVPKGTRIGGRGKGTPNKLTLDVRAAIAKIAEQKVKHVGKWLDRIAATDPARALDAYLHMIEYHIPKLSRAEVTGAKGDPIQVNIVDPTRRPLGPP